MASYRVKPSKPVAILVVVFVNGIGRHSGFIWLWAAACVAIVGFNLWAAFSKNGATEVVERRIAD
ncbi:hypothetical protein AB0E55_23755 [Amycolatopsis keratiniphila]|uniref:hypothetical protein n=1 Tax=Amycolatopsis keratiniphila TaxID=129921 RepID=UPI0033E89276